MFENQVEVSNVSFMYMYVAATSALTTPRAHWSAPLPPVERSTSQGCQGISTVSYMYKFKFKFMYSALRIHAPGLKSSLGGFD